MHVESGEHLKFFIYIYIYILKGVHFENSKRKKISKKSHLVLKLQVNITSQHILND